MKNKLLFFNKEGHLYNFEYDEGNEIYEGKILFDENSNDTFKTIGMYIFEEVKPIHFENNLKLKKIELYNYSGVTFQKSTYNNEKIENITAVNSSSDFYTKWIIGDNFENKFPKGSMIKFSNLTFVNPTSDFNFDYYTVLDNKPNAIMVQTLTNNDSWNNIFITGGTISSVNIVKYNDYDSTLIPTLVNYSFFSEKKLTISGSINNDMVNSFKYSGQTNTYYQTWNLSGNCNISDELKLELTLYTERPKLYQGEVKFLISGYTAYLDFKNGFSSLFNIEEGQEIIFEDYNDNPILPSNPIFTIIDGTNEIDLYDNNIEFFKIINVNKTLVKNFNSNSISKNRIVKNTNFFKKNISFFEKHLPLNMFEYDYYIKITGQTSNWLSELKKDDMIQFLSTTYNSSYKNLNKKVSIKKIKTFKDIRIEYYTNKINNDKLWLNTVIKKAIKNNNSPKHQIYLESLWLYDNNDNNINSPSYIPINERYEYIYLNEAVNIENILNKYNIKKILSASDITTVVCSLTTSLNESFTMNVIGYDTTNIVSFTSPILKEQNTNNIDYEETINGFNKKYINELNKYGLMFYHLGNGKIALHSKYHNNIGQNNYLDSKIYINNNSGITLNTSGITNSYISTAIIEFNEKLKNEEILPYEIEKFDKNFYAEIMLDLKNNENNYGLLIDINDIEYYENFSNSNQETIDNFIFKYQDIFRNNLGLNLTSGITTEPVYVNNYKSIRINYWSNKIIDSISWYKSIKEKALLNNISVSEQLYIEAEQLYEQNDPKTEIEYQSGQTMLIIEGLYSNIEVRTLKVKVNIYSNYHIMNKITNKSLFITGNEIELITTNPTFFDYGLSTGMIISLSGSNYSQNNKNYNIIGLTEDTIQISYQGLFFNDVSNISIDSQTYLRKPRESYNKDIYYSFRFEKINNEDFNDNIFFYDISGEHLKPAVDLITGEYIEATRYIGPKPLWSIENECNNDKIVLIDKPNDNINYIKDPTKQQTIFRGNNGEYCLNFLLDEIDSNVNFNFTPEPLQVFLGYNSNNEGVDRTKVSMDLIDNTIYSGYTNSNTNITDIEFTFNENGELTIHTSNIFDFHNLGFEKGQLITIDFIDETKTGSTLFLNYGIMKIEYLNGKTIKINLDSIDYKITPFDSRNTSESFKFIIKVQPKPILKLDIYGETEIEDERFDINLRNLGIDLNYDIEHIFKESDINEDGIDYKLLNKKRKEMLIMYPELYNYIGSYKALINAINFFGWNELELNEYYRNIKQDSDLYQKLQRVKINDIFDNTISGWSDDDNIKNAYENGYYKKTNLFNLTFRITDENGNIVLLHSLDEVQYKLKKLKTWLKNNVIPLSANLIDITGVAQTVNNNYHNIIASNNIKKVYSSNEVNAINFNLSETLNFAQNYLVQLDFYTLNNSNPSGWTCKIRTFMKNDQDEIIPQQYFKLMKNDLNSFSFNIDKEIDHYIMIETKSYNSYGFGVINNKFINTSTSRVYKLLNNNFHIPNEKNYLPLDGEYYWFDESGMIRLED